MQNKGHRRMRSCLLIISLSKKMGLLSVIPELAMEKRLGRHLEMMGEGGSVSHRVAGKAEENTYDLKNPWTDSSLQEPGIRSSPEPRARDIQASSPSVLHMQSWQEIGCLDITNEMHGCAPHCTFPIQQLASLACSGGHADMVHVKKLSWAISE